MLNSHKTIVMKKINKKLLALAIVSVAIPLIAVVLSLSVLRVSVVELPAAPKIVFILSVFAGMLLLLFSYSLNNAKKEVCSNKRTSVLAFYIVFSILVLTYTFFRTNTTFFFVMLALQIIFITYLMLRPEAQQ
jgi:hypothetical protein